MRCITEIKEFASYQDWVEATGHDKAYFSQKTYNFGKGDYQLQPTAVLIYEEDHITLRKARRPYSYAKRAYSDKIVHGESLLVLTPTTIEITCTKSMNWSRTRSMMDILESYGLKNVWIPCGKQRGEMAIAIPHIKIAPASNRRSWRDEEYLILALHSVLLKTGLQFNYRGMPINDKPPTVAECRKMAGTFTKRSVSASGTHVAARILGFGTAFDTNGYPLPKDKSRANLDMLNQQATNCGYVNVADAWDNNFPIIGEVDDEWMEAHKEGLTTLLVEKIKTDRKNR